MGNSVESRNPIFNASTVFSDRGERRAWVAVVRDVTERRRLEEALRSERATLADRVVKRTKELSVANARLERAARLKDQFLANMSHELRTPLNTILGSAEILQEKMFGPLTDEQNQYLSGIREGAEHLLEMITDILDVAKIESGRIELTRAPVDVGSAARAAIRLTGQAASERHLDVTVDTPDTDRLLVWGDERRIKQIIVNLLSNAVKFTPEGGSIGLKARRDTEAGQVVVEVWDTGIGFDEEGRELMFEPFVQLDGGLSRKEGGSGLGLSLVESLTRLHDGTVHVTSSPGQGSTFTVRLPAQDTSPRRRDDRIEGVDTADSTHSPVSGTPRLLIIDDDERTVQVFRTYLSMKGYEVDTASDAASALQVLESRKPDVMLIDIQLPGMDGMELIRRVRGNAHADDVLIIAVTALAMAGDMERCLSAGADRYMSKPLRLDQLVETIETLRTREVKK